MKKVREAARQNWMAYIEAPDGIGNRDIGGHLCLYPYVFSGLRWRYVLCCSLSLLRRPSDFITSELVLGFAFTAILVCPAHLFGCFQVQRGRAWKCDL
jgi:hypothetical protein